MLTVLKTEEAPTLRGQIDKIKQEYHSGEVLVNHQEKESATKQ